MYELREKHVDEEDGVFLVWGNEQGNNDSESSDILSFTYNRNIFHLI